MGSQSHGTHPVGSPMESRSSVGIAITCLNPATMESPMICRTGPHGIPMGSNEIPSDTCISHGDPRGFRWELDILDSVGFHGIIRNASEKRRNHIAAFLRTRFVTIPLGINLGSFRRHVQICPIFQCCMQVDMVVRSFHKREHTCIKSTLVNQAERCFSFFLFSKNLQWQLVRARC